MITNPKQKDRKSEAEINAWEMINSMKQSWIMNTIEPRLHMSVAYIDSTQKIGQHMQALCRG